VRAFLVAIFFACHPAFAVTFRRSLPKSYEAFEKLSLLPNGFSCSYHFYPQDGGSMTAWLDLRIFLICRQFNLFPGALTWNAARASQHLALDWAGHGVNVVGFVSQLNCGTVV
jgi:hypothetical protein